MAARAVTRLAAGERRAAGEPLRSGPLSPRLLAHHELGEAKDCLSDQGRRRPLFRGRSLQARRGQGGRGELLDKGVAKEFNMD